ncbi:hypothetical protein BDV18DRAFT_162178 [Aspergillus unguis]
MALSNSAVIVIVIVACLACVTLGAALFRQYNPAEGGHSGNRFSREQEMYMRSVRLKNLGFNYREARTPMPRDVESAMSRDDYSSRY